jgi:hypothetical protein
MTSKIKKNVNKIARNVYQNYKTKTSATLDIKIKKSCNYLKNNNFKDNCSYCKTCSKNIPKPIANIKYALNHDLPKKLEQVCKKYANDVLVGNYCKSCKRLLVLHGSSIGQFSNSELFEKNYINFTIN